MNKALFIFSAFALLISCTPVTKDDHVTVKYYIQGRLMESEISDPPFKVDGLKLHTDMHGRDIVLKFEDSVHYTLTYLSNGESVSQEGVFGTMLSNKDFEMKISKAERVSNETIDKFRLLDYRIKIVN